MDFTESESFSAFRTHIMRIWIGTAIDLDMKLQEESAKVSNYGSVWTASCLHTTTLVFDKATGTFRQAFWKDLYVGSIVKIKSKMQVPADIIILATSEVEGLGYVSTVTLDGE